MKLYLNDTERVISCPRGVQWIYQRNKSVSKPAWRNYSFCSTRDVLIQEILSQDRSEGIRRGAMKELLALPDNIVHLKRKK